MTRHTDGIATGRFAALAMTLVMGCASMGGLAQRVASLEAELKTLEERLERTEKDDGLATRLKAFETNPADRDRRIGHDDFEGRDGTSERDETQPTYRDRALALQSWG